MVVNYSTSTKVARMTATRDEIDGISGLPGYIEIGTVGMAEVLATLTLATPCGTVDASGNLILDAPRSDASADATGTATAARVKNSNGDTIIDDLTVGTVGTDIILTSVSIISGNPVTLNTIRINHA